MTDIKGQFLEQIELALSGSAPDSVAGSFAALSALAHEYGKQPLSPEAMLPLKELEELAEREAGGKPVSGERFRKALVQLQKLLNKAPAVQEPNSLASDPELVQEFLQESREHLANVESGLLTLERDPGREEALHAVFRSFHTIKGLAGFLGAETVQELAHETESVLDLVRSGVLVLTGELTDLILQSADQLTKLLSMVGKLSLENLPRADERLLAALAAITRAEHSAEEVDIQPAVAEAKEIKPDDAPKAEATVAKVVEGGAVRVDTAKLEYLIDMVGELVIAESVVRNDAVITKAEDPVLSRNLAQLARVVEEVQKTSMSMRMVPVGTLFRKMTRLVRDLSRKSGKPVDLVTFGDDVELDRTIVEELADPMVHMIRNAVDHGLESPDGRLTAGKSETGSVKLKATHDAGDIVIEISDDGKGLDINRIIEKAKRLGLIGADEHPSDEEAFKLIFEPGFSTAAKVTDMSGRGVGMDVVKKHIQKLRGRIDIRSVLGQGCTFILRLPLTLAIIDGLVVSVGSQRYILPMFAVREMFSPTEKTFVTVENRAEAALFRNKLMPVVRLSRVFHVEDASENPGILIIAEARDQLFCIAVDQLIGKQEVVIKSLGKTFRDVPAISGGAILGDGRVGLILDVNALR